MVRDHALSRHASAVIGAECGRGQKLGMCHLGVNSRVQNLWAIQPRRAGIRENRLKKHLEKIKAVFGFVVF